MARRRYRRYARAAYGRARSYFRPRFRRFRARAGTSMRGIKPNISLPFIVGTGAGLTTFSGSVPMEAKVVIACLPIRGGPVGMLKAAAQGMLIGDLIRYKTGFALPIPGAPAAGTGTRTFGSA